MTETRIPDYIHSWIEVSAADGSNRRRLPAVLFDSQEHFDSVRERYAALEDALREVSAALSQDIIEDDNVLDMQRIIALALGERDGVGREGPTVHDLKTWTEYYEAVADGRKVFEIRLNDRGYRVGDVLRLRDWDPDTGRYMGRQFDVVVTYITAAERLGVLKDGYVCMSIRRTEADVRAMTEHVRWAEGYANDCRRSEVEACRERDEARAEAERWRDWYCDVTSGPHAGASDLPWEEP